MPQSYRILIVDDGPVNLQLVQNVLSKVGYKTDTAENGRIAVDKLRHETFDLVLMDLEMPEMDGITASKIIRQELGLQIPIIAVSASERAPYQSLCIEAGMNGYVTKPFLPEELHSAIADILGKRPEATAESGTADGHPAHTLLDLTLLRQNSFNDEEFMKRMIALMITETTGRLIEIRAALDDEDYPKVRKTLHAMKPSVDHVAEAGIRSDLRHLETNEPDGAEFQIKAERLLDQLATLVEALRNL